MEEARRRWLVSGRVQGVFFRQSTAEEARRIGELRGWVRNLPDGRVEVVAAGSRGDLDRLEGFLRRGPPAARVEGLETADPPPHDPLGAFHVRG